MPFKDMRVKEIDYIIHHTPTVMKFSANNRPNHIIGIQLSGKGEHYFKDRNLTLEENCIYFLNQSENYDVEIINKGVAFSIHFTSFEPIDTKSFSIKINNSDTIIKLLERIENKFNASSLTTASSLSDLYALFSLYEEIYSKKYFKQNNKWNESIRYINLHFKERDCLKKAAEIYGVSCRRFNDIFKDNFVVTPNTYIINQKISLSKKLILTGEHSITDISALCGFSDVYYFSKLFKKEVGVSPSKYKKK